MSEFNVQVMKIGPVEQHPDTTATEIELTRVNGDYPVVVRKGAFKEGDLALYLPVDSVVRPDLFGCFAFLAHQGDLARPARVKAKRLRGVFSMGVLIPVTELPEVMRDADGEQVQPVEGADLAGPLRVTKQEEHFDAMGRVRLPGGKYLPGDSVPDPVGWAFPRYTDLDSLRKWNRPASEGGALEEGEEVVLTEKVHGCNGRFVMDATGRMWCGSMNHFRKEGEGVWWRAAYKHDLPRKLSAYPMLALYGEVYGDIQDLKYNHDVGDCSVLFFDACDLKTGRYLDADKFYELMEELDLPTAPILYKGPWHFDLRDTFAEGKSMLSDHVREGFVVRPVHERWHDRLGRVVLKMVGQGYLLRGAEQVRKTPEEKALERQKRQDAKKLRDEFVASTKNALEATYEKPQEPVVS